MQSKTTEKITNRIKQLSPRQREEVLEFVEKLEPPRRSLLDIWQELAKDIPDEELEKIPTDASYNLDHYLYGAPKK